MFDADGQIGEVKVNNSPLISNLKNLPFGPTESMSMEDEKLNITRDYTLRYQSEQILAKWGIPSLTLTPTEPPFPTPEPTEPPSPTSGTGPTVTLSEAVSISSPTITDNMQDPTPINPSSVQGKHRFKTFKKPVHEPRSDIKPGKRSLQVTGPEPNGNAPGEMQTESLPVASVNSEPAAPPLNKTGGNETVLTDFKYTYYADGNVKTIDGPAIPSMSGKTTTYSLAPDKGNRLDSVTAGELTVTYTYDNVGNITSDGNFTFEYNQSCRLVKVKQGETVIAEYFYNAFGQRIKKAASGKTVYYHYDQRGDLLAEGCSSII